MSNSTVTITDAEPELVKTILKGRQQVVSHSGTSQYATGSGLAACGLAALNCARIVLGREHAGVRDEALLRDVLSRETMEACQPTCSVPCISLCSIPRKSPPSALYGRAIYTWK
jgi:hypothetical protein